MAETIRHTFFFAHPPKAVWAYLTEPELMAQWLMKNDFQPILGYEFQFRTNPIPSLNIDGIFHCRVLEIVPFKKLSYSWKGGPGNGKITLDSVVVWKLEAKDDGTALFLEHSGFSMPENLSIYTGMTDGWIANLHKMAERINAANHDTTHT